MKPYTLIFCLTAAPFLGQVRNPHSSPADVAAGARSYRSHCAECHGRKGEGGRGPDLTRGEYRHGSSEAALFKTIDDGIPGTGMPGIYFEDVQIWQLVAFVRTLASPAAQQTVAGSRSHGEQLFFGKAGCAGCHMVQGRGGRSGPDLSFIGSARVPQHLRRSLLKPSEEFPIEWWTVQAEDSAGNRYQGIRLNEDTYSIQLLDQNGELLTLPKAALRQFQAESKQSPMPSYEGKLTTSELDDVVAYLYSLQRKAKPQ
ncbi:MAG TPA: c-type cytochrome [Bryobacteraceae bacterium]|nr:c-type cytochrome [Bryobacteraceae bacterium]